MHPLAVWHLPLFMLPISTRVKLGFIPGQLPVSFCYDGTFFHMLLLCLAVVFENGITLLYTWTRHIMRKHLLYNDERFNCNAFWPTALLSTLIASLLLLYNRLIKQEVTFVSNNFTKCILLSIAWFEIKNHMQRVNLIKWSSSLYVKSLFATVSYSRITTCYWSDKVRIQ